MNNSDKKLKYMENAGFRDVVLRGNLSNDKEDIEKGNKVRYPESYNLYSNRFLLNVDKNIKNEDYRKMTLKQSDSNDFTYDSNTGNKIEKKDLDNSKDVNANKYSNKNYMAPPNKNLRYGIAKDDINLDLRLGLDTRQGDNISNIELSDFRFEKLSRNYQNADNIVLPFPRGGIDTRNLDKFSKNKKK